MTWIREVRPNTTAPKKLPQGERVQPVRTNLYAAMGTQGYQAAAATSDVPYVHGRPVSAAWNPGPPVILKSCTQATTR